MDPISLTFLAFGGIIAYGIYKYGKLKGDPDTQAQVTLQTALPFEEAFGGLVYMLKLSALGLERYQILHQDSDSGRINASIKYRDKGARKGGSGPPAEYTTEILITLLVSSAADGTTNCCISYDQRSDWPAGPPPEKVLLVRKQITDVVMKQLNGTRVPATPTSVA